MQLPPPFEQQMRTLLGLEAYAAFSAALQEAPPVSIRKNPLKVPRETAAFFPTQAPVPWHPEAHYLQERPVFTLDPLIHAGAYYVQEASSMFLQEALRQTMPIEEPLRVLDLCAAPGGKSTLLLSGLPNSLVVSNELVRSRVGTLRENLERWGHPNMAVTSAEAQDFQGLKGFFDLVVTDAPCSGEGLFRKEPEAMQEWSTANVYMCAGRQRQILSDVFETLKPGGLLIYSTCTYNAQENDDNAEWLCQELQMTPVHLSPPSEWGVSETKSGYQFFPHLTRGEGFYLALFRKPDAAQAKTKAPSSYRSLQPVSKKLLPELRQWMHQDADFQYFQTPGGDILALSGSFEPAYRSLDKVLRNKWFGTNIGTFKGKNFIPSHALALSTQVSPALPHVSFSREQALRYLKKEVFDLPDGAPSTGWVLARYEGLNLGWLKALPNRWNNYLPLERRIRMAIN